jgi:hypothetical protein
MARGIWSTDRFASRTRGRGQMSALVGRGTSPLTPSRSTLWAPAGRGERAVANGFCNGCRLVGRESPRGRGITEVSHAIINNMEVGDIRFYKERWKAVEEIERQELRAMSLEEHWRKLNAIVRFAIETGMTRDDNDGEMEVFLRWAKLKGAA